MSPADIMQSAMDARRATFNQEKLPMGSVQNVIVPKKKKTPPCGLCSNKFGFFVENRPLIGS